MERSLAYSWLSITQTANTQRCVHWIPAQSRRLSWPWSINAFIGRARIRICLMRLPSTGQTVRHGRDPRADWPMRCAGAHQHCDSQDSRWWKITPAGLMVTTLRLRDGKIRGVETLTKFTTFTDRRPERRRRHPHVRSEHHEHATKFTNAGKAAAMHRPLDAGPYERRA